jgi:hypothetical protein
LEKDFTLLDTIVLSSLGVRHSLEFPLRKRK